MLCTINHDSTGDHVDLNFVQGGVIGAPVSQPFAFGTDLLYRMRLTQNGPNYSCEVVASGFPTTTVTAQVSPAPGGPQFISLYAANLEIHFHSVVAESVLP